MTLLVVRGVLASTIVPRERGRVVHHHGAGLARRCPAPPPAPDLPENPLLVPRDLATSRDATAPGGDGDDPADADADADANTGSRPVTAAGGTAGADTADGPPIRIRFHDEQPRGPLG